MKLNVKVLLLFLSALIIAGCSTKQELKIEYEKYNLANGLEVILHEDKSDPIVSLAVLYHVGSNREEVGKTGFAHLFEHILFQESQHVGQDQFFKKIQGAGGTLNGGTWKDGTVYYEVVPQNALEMILWMESDRMGFLLSTVTQEAFANQQDVVQNEKRQNYDNRPYGHTGYIIDKLLYPADHPYNWQTIGSMEDLRNATLKDVRDFYTKWYGPNNATLVLAGDINKEEAKKLIEKYFGEIKSSESVDNIPPRRVTLTETKKAFHEDTFAKSPELTMVFPTLEQYEKDAYAIDMLAELFAGSKKSPLYKIIVEEQKLAPSVSCFQNNQELAGEFRVRIRAFPDKNLTDVENAVHEAFKRFETDKFSDKDLARIKAKVETNFYNGISSLLGKSFQLSIYNEFAGTPGFVTEDLKRTVDVTKEDIWSAYDKYIKDKPYVLTSFVPLGETALIAENSERFPLAEESLSPVEKTESAEETLVVEKIPTLFDRTVEPPMGPDPLLSIPTIWTDELGKGLKIYGIQQSELPLVQFALKIKGGLLLDDMNKIGVANLITDMMMQGTKNKTPVELEEAIDDLGASINMYTTNEAIVIQANCLSSKFEETYALMEEILLEPRWDEKEFSRIKDETIESIKRNQTNPNSVSSNVFDKLVYGPEHIFSFPTSGTIESVNEITIEDLKEYYNNYFSPSISHVTIVGDVDQAKATGVFHSLSGKWESRDVTFPEFKLPENPPAGTIYFVDFPGAKQSVIRIGNLSLPYTDPDYFKITVMNYKLGGSFNGILNLILREEKGYTYGARSGFQGIENGGTFAATAGVQSATTLESVQIFRDEMTKYRDNISDEDLEFTKNALIKSNARRFETIGALRGMLDEIATYNLPFDYIKEQETIIQNMTADEHLALAQKYLHPEKMIYVIVGDAATQLKPLKSLGLGEPVLLDKEGNPLMDKILTKL